MCSYTCQFNLIVWKIFPIRNLVHQDGDYHRAVHVWIYAESTGELLLQKRSDNKDSWPGQWDISSAGHISAGDTSLDTAQYASPEESIPTAGYCLCRFWSLFLLKCVFLLPGGSWKKSLASPYHLRHLSCFLCSSKNGENSLESVPGYFVGVMKPVSLYC